MSWADPVKAAALAAVTERKANAARIVADAPWTWNPHDVWLSRVRSSGSTPSANAISDAPAQSVPGIAPRS